MISVFVQQIPISYMQWANSHKVCTCSLLTDMLPYLELKGTHLPATSSTRQLKLSNRQNQTDVRKTTSVFCLRLMSGFIFCFHPSLRDSFRNFFHQQSRFPTF